MIYNINEDIYPAIHSLYSSIPSIKYRIKNIKNNIRPVLKKTLTSVRDKSLDSVISSNNKSKKSNINKLVTNSLNAGYQLYTVNKGIPTELTGNDSSLIKTIPSTVNYYTNKLLNKVK